MRTVLKIKHDAIESFKHACSIIIIYIYIYIFIFILYIFFKYYIFINSIFYIIIINYY